MAKKFDKDNIERIVELVLEINGQKDRTSGNGIAVFCNISPQVQWLTIGIHLNGWESGSYEDESYIVKTRPEDKYASYDDAKKVIARLEKLLEKQKEFDAKQEMGEEKKKYEEIIEKFWGAVEWYNGDYDRGDEPPERVREIAHDYSKGFIRKKKAEAEIEEIAKPIVQEEQ